MPVKIAFMFLVIDKFHHEQIWAKFFKGASKNKYSIYIHAKDDQDTNFENQLFKDAVIPSVETAWGYLMGAEFQLLSHALKKKNNSYFVLLSDTCIPLKSFNDVYSTITNRTKSMLCPSKSSTRTAWNNYYDEMEHAVEKDGFLKHSQWITLTREDAEFGYQQKDLLEDWGLENVQAPDEVFFGTVLLSHNKVSVNEKDCDEWVDWKTSDSYSSPRTYDEISVELLSSLLASKFLFARKFPKDSIVIFKDEDIYLDDLMVGVLGNLKNLGRYHTYQ